LLISPLVRETALIVRYVRKFPSLWVIGPTRDGPATTGFGWHLRLGPPSLGFPGAVVVGCKSSGQSDRCLTLKTSACRFRHGEHSTVILTWSKLSETFTSHLPRRTPNNGHSSACSAGAEKLLSRIFLSHKMQSRSRPHQHIELYFCLEPLGNDVALRSAVNVLILNSLSVCNTTKSIHTSIAHPLKR